jgi:hypothetical protein
MMNWGDRRNESRPAYKYAKLRSRGIKRIDVASFEGAETGVCTVAPSQKTLSNSATANLQYGRRRAAKKSGDHRRPLCHPNGARYELSGLIASWYQRAIGTTLATRQTAAPGLLRA